MASAMRINKNYYYENNNYSNTDFLAGGNNMLTPLDLNGKHFPKVFAVMTQTKSISFFLRSPEITNVYIRITWS
jgi:hypothetical protein